MALKQTDSSMFETLWPDWIAIMISEELFESWKSDERFKTCEYAAVLRAPEE